MERTLYVFGYGSLINAESASRALRREVSVSDFILASLQDYRRTWVLEDQVFSADLNKVVSAVFLDVERASGANLNGVLLEVSASELAILQLREKNYHCVDVTASVLVENHCFRTFPSNVYTFSGKEECRVKTKDAYVLKRYLNMVHSACEQLGENFMRQYSETTMEFNFPILNGQYTFVDAIQAQSV